MIHVHGFATALGCACLTAMSGSVLAADAAVEPVTVRAVAQFGFDQTAVLPADQKRLLAEVGRMQGVSWQTVTAVGHTDSVGAVAHNQRLAARRAAAVKAYLVSQGLPAELIRTEARGPDSPLADNASESGRARNRRAEVVFEGVRTAP